MVTALLIEDKFLKLSSIGLSLSGVTLDSQVYVEAVSQALTLASDLIVQAAPVRPIRKLAPRESERRMHLLRGDFIGPVEPGHKRICINVVNVELALSEPYSVRRSEPPIRGLVEYVGNPELPWVVCDIPFARLDPQQRDALRRTKIHLYYLDPAWIVGVNGVPIATFERLWTQHAADVPTKPPGTTRGR